MFQRTKICTGLLLAFGSIAVFAQDATPPVQRVEITGSSIKRVDAETALPVQTVSRSEIDSLGVTNTEQLFQSITANSMVGATNTAQGAGASTYGLATVSLRGLGAQRTLVLVDGRRIANYATDGTAVDINSIPLAAVERVEILKDGASGVYGSDAVAGVVNFILRKDFRGVELNGYYAVPTEHGGGKTSKGSMVFGFGDYDQDHFSAMFSLDVEHEEAIYGRDRSYANRAWDDAGYFEQSATASGFLRSYNPSASPGLGINYPQGHSIGNPLAVSAATQDCALNGSGFDPNYAGAYAKNPDGTCRYNSSPFVPLVPEVHRVNALGNLRTRIDQDNEFFLDAFISNTKTLTTEQASPYAVNFLTTDALFAKNNVAPAIIFSPSNPYYQQYAAPFLAGTAYAGQPVTVSYRAVDGGARSHTDNATQAHLATGLRGTIANTDYDVAYSHNSSSVSEDTKSGYQSQFAMVELLDNNPLFNPYAATQTPALAAQINATNYVGNIIKSSLTTDAIDAKAQHTLATLPGGDLALAVGVSFRKEEMKFDPSAAYQSGDISGYGGQVAPLAVSRNSSSVFAEIDAPITKQLETDLSVRTDHYPNATSTNPKLSVRFLPVQQVLLRGSAGTGFREPSLPELYTQQTPGTTPTFTDPVTGSTGQYTETTGSPTSLLKPEKSKQFTLGIVLEPVKDLSASFDYYHIQINHAIFNYGPQFIVDEAAAGVPFYTPLVTRTCSNPADPTSCDISNIQNIQTNSSSMETAGVDVDLKWKSVATAAGTFGAELSGTWVQKYDLTPQGVATTHNVGQSVFFNTADSPPEYDPLPAVSDGGIIFRWRHELTGSWQRGPVSLSITQNYQSGYSDNVPANEDPTNPATSPAKVKSFQTWDLQGSFSGIKNLTLRLGVKNFADRKPPTAITLGQYFQVGYDNSYYDAHGRTVWGSVGYKF